MTDANFTDLRKWLKDQKYAYDRVPGVPQQGIELSEAGRVFFSESARQLANSPTPNLITSDGWQLTPTHTRTRDDE
jgi:hypothetical protein